MISPNMIMTKPRAKGRAQLLKGSNVLTSNGAGGGF